MNGLAAVTRLAGMGSLAGQVPVSISLDSTRQRVGQPPIYRITGAPPGQGVLWTSYRNGAPTGEKDDFYGHTIEANGTLEIQGDPWKSEQVGRWQKQIEINGPDGQRYLGQVEFLVEPDTAAQPNAPIYPQPNQGGDLFTQISETVSNAPWWALLGGSYLLLKGLKVIK